MEIIKKWFIEFWTKPMFTGFDGLLIILLGSINSLWYTVPTWLWIIIGSTLVTHKYYKVEKKEAN